MDCRLTDKMTAENTDRIKKKSLAKELAVQDSKKHPEFALMSV